MQEKFWGRKDEFKQLKRIDQQKKAALIVCSGRRRIGKSRLIQEFAKTLSHFIEIQGLAPRKGQTSADQLHWFAQELSRQTGLPQLNFSDWSSALRLLANFCENKHILIFLDEISWMGHGEPDFPGILKSVWDTQFKKNPRLRLVLCGSVSSWIQKNILQSTDFMGRISLEILLKELTLAESILFWGKKSKQTSDLEKLRVLSLTGGVPRYLEEINFSKSAEENYQNLCFLQTGFLYSEFEKIFNDIFERRSDSYQKIVLSLLKGPQSLSGISSSTKLPVNGVVSEYLNDLVLSGFIRKEIMWDMGTKKEKVRTIRYRLSDNYVRFYLKYIYPNKAKIEKGLFKDIGIDKITNFDSFIGLQFENLILNSLPKVCEVLDIPLRSVQNAGSFFQPPTSRQRGCQIDLLIQTKNTLYVCELKCRTQIDNLVIEEVQEKLKRFKYPKSLTLRPILIYAGTLTPDLAEQDYFHQLINFSELCQ